MKALRDAISLGYPAQPGLTAGQLGWEVAVKGAAGISLATTVWHALVLSGAPGLSRREAKAI